MNITKQAKNIIGAISPKLLIDIEFFHTFHRRLDWDNPRDINEKINWLKLYGDISSWVIQADKYAVRSYVESCGLSDILIPLYGKWDNVEDIDWNSLPNRFVMKVNNGCGDIVICNDKSELDIPKIEKIFSGLLKKKFGHYNLEPQYELMKPCIVAEKLLDYKKQSINTTSLIDYKIWCFNGNPYCIFVCMNRNIGSFDVSTYDLDWNLHSEWNVSSYHIQRALLPIPKPKCLDKMLNYASILAQGHPQVRVDLYEVDGQIYFGELTFTSAGGFMNYFSRDFLNSMGDQVRLPEKNV